LPGATTPFAAWQALSAILSLRPTSASLNRASKLARTSRELLAGFDFTRKAPNSFFMPAKKDQAPADLRYFNQTQK
jgi:hypothetical protein